MVGRSCRTRAERGHHRRCNYLALMKRFFASQTADELRVRINSYLEAHPQPEFSEVWIVRGLVDVHPRMAKFTLAFLEHEFLHGRLSA